MSNRTIKLARGEIDGRDAFRVLVVKNSTAYRPGQVLDQKQVDDMIEFGRWEVTVVELKQQGEEH